MGIPSIFFDQHPNPMLVYDIKTFQILEVNKSAIKKYGFTRDEFLSITIEDIRPPEDIPELRNRLEDLSLDSEVADLGTFRHKTKEGKLLYVQVWGQYFSANGRDSRIVYINDITESVKLKNEVEEAYQDQHHHIENNPLGMVKYDDNFRIIEWSKRAEEKTGYSKEELLGKSTFDARFFDENEEEFVKKRMLDISSGEKDKDRFETRIRKKNDELMDVLIHASALRKQDGKLKSVLAFIENISDRKSYERQLEKREHKYHSLFENASDGIFLMNNTTYIDCNQRVTEIFGASKEKIIGKTPLDFSPEVQPDGKLSSKKAREKIELVKKGEPQIFEWKHQSLNGEQKDTEISLNRIELDEDIYIQAILRDLTEHKKIKGALEIEQHRLKLAQRLAGLGWWSYDVEENRIIWSDILYDILDVDKDDFGATFEAFNDLVHPEDRDKLAEVMEQARNSEQPLDYILRIGDRDSDVTYVKGRAQSTLNNDGELVYMSGVLQDVTSQKQAQDEIRKREQLFESLFVDSPVAIAMIDTKGAVQKINTSFEKLFGYAEEELLGKDLLKHQLPEKRYNEISDIYENVFSDKDSTKYYEDQRITKNGDTKNLLVGALPVKINGEPIAGFGIYTDITKLRNTEKNLQESLKEKEVLLSEIHHRVKNNLAVICGLLELEAMNCEEGSVANKVLKQSKLRIHSMASIHEQLYNSQDFANLSLEDYIYDLVETIAQSFKSNKKDIITKVICDDVSLNINQAVPCALIINELVTNAFKYAFEESHQGELDVTFSYDGELITIVVDDNGPGLPENFEAMAKQSLGHQLVQQLVKQLDGDINVQTAVGEGTYYEIRFKKAQKSGSASNHFV